MDPLLSEKFHSKIIIDQHSKCWNWDGHLNVHGLPIIHITIKPRVYKIYSARRVSLQLKNKLVDNKVCLPTCKNKICVNPDHLVCGDEARFWNSIQKLSEPDGCWVWTKQMDKDMYGDFLVSKNHKLIHIKAHVYSWQLYTGRSVPKGILVCHTCDHPYCVNPQHLFLGTTKDNSLDMMQKNRGPSKLNPESIKEIRDLSSNMTLKELSIKYGVSDSTISDIKLRKSWKHIL